MDICAGYEMNSFALGIVVGVVATIGIRFVKELLNERKR